MMRKVSALTPLFLPFVLSLSKHRTSFPALRAEGTALRQARGERRIWPAWLLAAAIVIATLLAGCERPAPDAKTVAHSTPLMVAARVSGHVRAEEDSQFAGVARAHRLAHEAR